jgi:hypothetical protein
VPQLPGINAAEVKKMSLGAMLVFDGLIGDAVMAGRIKVGAAGFFGWECDGGLRARVVLWV